MFCCMLLYVHSSIAIILMGKRELVALLNLSSWCLVMVERLFLAVPRGCLRFVISVFLDHTHLLFYIAASIEECSLDFFLNWRQTIWFSGGRRGSFFTQQLKTTRIYVFTDKVKVLIF